jgi:hypothetical protein
MSKEASLKPEPSILKWLTVRSVGPKPSDRKGVKAKSSFADEG